MIPSLVNSIRRMLFENAALKLLSLVFALALWIFVSIGQSLIEMPKGVPLTLRNLPKNLIRTSDIVNQIDIKVLGTSAQLRGIDNDKLSYEIDLSDAQPGTMSRKIIQTRIQGIPSGVKITEIVPSRVTITVSERIEKTVPVEVVTRGEVALGYVVTEKTANPPLVRVSGAREEVEALNSIATEIVDIAGRKRNYTGTRALDVVGRHMNVLDTEDVKVRVKIDRDVTQRNFRDVPIVVRNTELKWTVKPTSLDLPLKGPADVLLRLTPETIRLAIDASGLNPGKYKLKPKVFVADQEDERELVFVGLNLPDVDVTLTSE
ncbi:MAG: hypothetical protein H6683_01745 [Deltaproteobacteria bacterium]|nr:hypothetical protein [Deltaproteobacteria bacterium]MCB9478380.1 hypothetical protein [Deltaproteobacteria bacterium]